LGVQRQTSRRGGRQPALGASDANDRNLLTGPVAYAIGLIGIAIAGGTMLWGGELTEFGRRACMVGLVVSVLVFAAPMLASAFGVNAAVL
jgi:type IV secretion system protein TrbC